MIPIIFRGIKKDGSRWVYGSYHQIIGNGEIRCRTIYSPYFKDEPASFNLHCILERKLPDTECWNIRDSFTEHIVMQESIGMTTGMFDSEKHEVSLGDILESTTDEMFLKWEVVYKHGCFGIRNIGIDGYVNHEEFHPCDSEYYFEDRIIIGTIHDHLLSV